MPRTAQERIVSQTQLDPRDTFDWTTPNLNVTARPTDPMVYSPPVSQGQRAARLMKSLGLLTEEAGKLRDVYNKEAFEEGQLSALKGEEPVNKTWAALKGYDTLNGSLTALTDYQKEVELFLAENPEMTDEELEQGLNQLSQKHLQGVSDDFLKGFIEPALTIEQQAIKNHTNKTIQQMREQAFIKINTQVQESLKLEVNKLLDPLGVSLGTLLDNPEAYRQLKEEGLLKDLGQTLRDNLSLLQATSEVAGITKSEISGIYVDQVGKLAVELGLPELLDFAFIPDESKVSLDKTNLQNAIYKYRDDSRRVAQGFKNAFENAQREAEKAGLQQMEYNSTLAISNARLAQPGDLEIIKSLEEQRRAILDNPLYASSTNGKQALAKIDELLMRTADDPPQWLKTSTREVKIDLMQDVALGKITLEKIEQSVNHLSEADYEMFMRDYKAIKERQDKAAKDGEKSPYDEPWRFQSLATTLVNEKKQEFDKVLGALTIPNPEAKSFFVENSWMKVHAFVRENNRWPDDLETHKIITDTFNITVDAFSTKTEETVTKDEDIDYSGYPETKTGTVRKVKNFMGKDPDRTPDGRAMPVGTRGLMSSHSDDISNDFDSQNNDITDIDKAFIEEGFKLNIPVEEIINYLVNQGSDEQSLRKYIKEEVSKP